MARGGSTKGKVAPTHRPPKARGFHADEAAAIRKDVKETKLLMVEIERSISFADEPWGMHLTLDAENIDLLGASPSDLLRKLADVLDGTA